MELTILILLLPFFSFLILGIGGKWMSHRTAGTIGTLILGAVAVLSYVTAIQYFSAPRLEDGTFATLIPYNFTWLPFTETLHFDLGILLDPISVMMLIVISTVSLMVHIYSFGYMKGEVGFQRYYAFLSLFTMSMLGLVVATNIFQMYLFWELVGVSSYLLIGFYYTKPAAIAASNGNFGLEDGDYVGLPTDADSWNFETFTTDEYEALKEKIKSGEITVDNSSDDSTKPTVSEFTTVNYIQ